MNIIETFENGTEFIAQMENLLLNGNFIRNAIAKLA